MQKLERLEGYRTLWSAFDKQGQLPNKRLFLFSHRVPAYKMQGHEMVNIPKGVWDIDPAGFPQEAQGIEKLVPQAHNSVNCFNRRVTMSTSNLTASIILSVAFLSSAWKDFLLTGSSLSLLPFQRQLEMGAVFQN